MKAISTGETNFLHIHAEPNTYTFTNLPHNRKPNYILTKFKYSYFLLFQLNLESGITNFFAISECTKTVLLQGVTPVTEENGC